MRLIRGIPRVLHWAGAFALMAMMLTVVANVVGRKVPFLSPIKGTFEIVEFLGLIAVACFFAQAAVEGRHIALDILFSRLSAGMRLVLRRVISPLSIAMLALIAWLLAQRAVNMYAVGQVSQTMHFALFPLYTVACIGFAALSVVLLLEYVALWRGGGE